MKKRKTAGIPNDDEKQERIKYTIDKKEFIITPIYRKSGETIHEILVKLMQSETKKP